MLWPLSLVLAALVNVSLGQPLVYGLQAQRPPVARVGQTWTWTLLNGTFTSSSSETLVYSASGLPAWASFDSSTLTFSGLPKESDVGGADVWVRANTTSGTSSDSFRLLVSDAPAPVIKWPLAQQLYNGTSLPEGCVLHFDNSLRIPPWWSFSIGLQWNTFALPQDAFAFYTAYQVGTTSLPSWLQFDPATVTFNGVAQAAGFYQIVVFGSDHQGYGDVSQTFSLTIADHGFDLVSPLTSLNTSLGANVEYVVSTSNLTIDHVPATPDNITAISVDLSAVPFLSFSKDTRTISGQVPGAASRVMTTQIPIVFNNTYGQSLTTSLNFTVMGATNATGLLSNVTIPDLLLEPGQSFSYDLSSYAISSSVNYSISTAPSDASSWLDFDATKRVLSGTAPDPIPSYGNVSVTLIARDPASGARESSGFLVAFDSTAASPLLNASGGSSGLSLAAKIALGVCLGGLGLALLILGACWCCRRRRRDAREASVESETTLKSDMSPYPMGNSPLPDQPLTPFTPISPLPEKPRIFAGMFRKKQVPREESMQEAFNEPRRFGLLSVVTPHAPKGLGIQSPDSSFDVQMGTHPSTYRAPSQESIADSFLSRQDSTSTSSMLYEQEPEPPKSVPRRWVPRPYPLPAGAAHDARHSQVSLNHALPPAPQSEEDDTMHESPTHTSSIVTATRQRVDYSGANLRDVESRKDVRDQTTLSSRDEHARSRYIDPIEGIADSQTPRNSAYVPPEGTPVTSAVVYSPGASTIERPQSPNEYGNLRMVSASGATRSNIFARPETPQTPEQPIRHRRGKSEDHDSSVNLKHEPQDVTVKTSGVLKFVPQLMPRPVAILGSPGRTAPRRATYTAHLVDPQDADETRRPLPKWLTWNDQTLEFWGIPKEADVGDLHIQIIAKKPPASPRRDTFTRPESPVRPDTAEERLVARVHICVVQRASRIPKAPVVVTY